MSETAKEPKKISKRSSEEKIEIIVAIFLGITALATAWASWIGSLHGGNQATNYTKSNNLSSEGNSMWNEASQNLMQDMITWNDINEANLNYQYAESKNDKAEMEKYQYQIDQLMSDNCTEEFLEAINWAMDQKENVTPFMKDGYTESYFAEAQATIEESDKLLEKGKKDNANGDAFGLVTVIYSVVLFLLGIAGSFNHKANKYAVVIIALVAFVIATIYMFTLPMPTGFNITSFFKG